MMPSASSRAARLVRARELALAPRLLTLVEQRLLVRARSRSSPCGNSTPRTPSIFSIAARTEAAPSRVDLPCGQERVRLADQDVDRG